MRNPFVIALLTFLMGCGESTPARAPVLDDDEDGLSLIENGVEPRRMLRYAIPVGVERTRVTYDIDMRMVPRGVTERGPVEGSIRMEVELATSSRLATGDVVDQRIHVEEAAVVESTGEPAIAIQFRAIEAMRGLTFTSRLEPSGVYADRVVPELSDPSPQVAVSLDLMLETVFGATPLPAEAVGVGARWEAHRSTAFVGPSTPTRQRTTYELLAFEGERSVRLRVRSRQLGAGRGGAAQPETRLVSDGTGEFVVDLTRTFPVGEAIHEGDAEVFAQAGRPALDIHQRLRMRYSRR